MAFIKLNFPLLTVSVLSVPAVLLLYLIRKYRESKWGVCTNKVKLNGKVAIVTGANSGLGFEVAKELALRNAEVILACRTMAKANQAAERIKCEVKHGILIPMEIDLGSLKSIESFTKQIKHNKIDILINNAGVAYPRGQRLQTVDGFEIHFGVNHLGHFHLTNLLEPLLIQDARVIVVASQLHEKGKLDLQAIKSMNFEENENLYANSKLANVYFARELARRNKKVRVYTVCPGWVYTGLFRHSFKWYHLFIMVPVGFWFMRSPKQATLKIYGQQFIQHAQRSIMYLSLLYEDVLLSIGAQTITHCATDPELENESGDIYRNCQKYQSNAIFYDKLAMELWKMSENLTNQ